jgi:hypothetical protein
MFYVLFKAKNQGVPDKLSHLSLRLIKVNRAENHAGKGVHLSSYASRFPA